jgi:signal transduction histidine kinase
MNHLPRENRRRRKRYSIFVLVWAWLSILTVVMVLVGLARAISAGQSRQQLVHSMVDRSLQLAVASYRSQLNDAKTLLAALLRHKTFLAQVKASAPNVLDTILVVPSPQGTNFFVGVWDNQQQLLAKNTVSHSFEFASENLSNDLAKALKRQGTNRIERDPSGLARSILVAPIIEESSPEPIGVLVVGFYLDDSVFHQAFLLNDQQELVVVANGEYISTRLGGTDGMPLTGKPALPLIVDAEKRNVATSFFTFPSAQGDFDFKFVPLSERPDPSSMLGIGTPAISLAEQTFGLFNDYALPFFLVFVVVGAVGLVYARDLNAGILTLRTAMLRLSAGDLSTKIPVDRPDEIGDLAGGLERVRQHSLNELEAARVEKQSYANTIAAMPVAIITTNSAQQISLVNPAAERLLKETRQQLAGKPLVSLFLSDSALDLSSLAWVFEPATSGAANSSPIHLAQHLSLRKNSLTKVDVVSSPIVIGENISGFVHVLLDATTHEAELRAKDDFMVMASHELRTPLAKLRAANELLTEAYADKNWEQMEALLENNQRTILRFQVFVENLIVYGSVQAGRFRVRTTLTDYNKILNDALVEIQPFYHSGNGAVELHSTIPTPCMVPLDARRIGQVLFNLLSNAVKYGKVDTPISVSVLEENASVVTRVVSYGPAIPPEAQAQIFNRYVRGADADSEETGLGLGLAIARDIVEQHGGEIGVESDNEHGTCFWFRLPAAQ